MRVDHCFGESVMRRILEVVATKRDPRIVDEDDLRMFASAVFENVDTGCEKAVVARGRGAPRQIGGLECITMRVLHLDSHPAMCCCFHRANEGRDGLEVERSETDSFSRGVKHLLHQVGDFVWTAPAKWS